MVADTDLPIGLACPLVTPLKRKGDQVDLEGLDRLITHVAGQVDALLLGDPFWGESLVLPGNARLEAVFAALEIIQGKWPVLITITSQSTKDTVDLMMGIGGFLERSSYDGTVFWVDYPLYHHSNRGLPQWFESVTSKTRIPFLLGNHAGVVDWRRRPIKHKNIKTSVLKKLSYNMQVKGLVFTGSLRRSANYHRAIRHRRDFKFFDGDEMVFVKQPSSDGVFAGGANLLPQDWGKITRSCLHRYDGESQYGDHARHMMETAAMLEAFHRLYQKNPAAVMKRLLHVAGLLSNAQIASGTASASEVEDGAIRAVCSKYGLV
jgi:dihydrodipicolinate synthase/N-acetylneuraminate lyase